VQLVDATTGADLWAERYDRPMKDIFSLQDEIVRRIVTTLNLQLTLWEKYGVLVHKRTDNLEAYDDLLRGVEYSFSSTKQGNEKARQMYEKAIALDPKYAGAYAQLAWTYYSDWIFQWSSDPHALDRVFDLAQQAVGLDDSRPAGYILLNRVSLYKRQYEQAVSQIQRAIELDPNNAFAYFWLGNTLALSGRPAEAIGVADKAMRLDPRNRDSYLFTRIMDLRMASSLLITLSWAGTRRRGRKRRSLSESARSFQWTCLKSGRHLRITYSEIGCLPTCVKQA
jgi:adenylate cyclase